MISFDIVYDLICILFLLKIVKQFFIWLESILSVHRSFVLHMRVSILFIHKFHFQILCEHIDLAPCQHGRNFVLFWDVIIMEVYVILKLLTKHWDVLTYLQINQNAHLDNQSSYLQAILALGMKCDKITYAKEFIITQL